MERKPQSPIPPLEQMAVVMRSVESIHPYPKNARKHTHGQIQKLAKIISSPIGWTKPIIIDESGMILAGHGALLAAKFLNLDAVPCIVKSGLKQSEKRAYILADNRVGEDSTWDLGMLSEEFAALAGDGIDMDLTGFNADDMAPRADKAHSSGVQSVEVSELQDRFWISLRGPLKQQHKVLQALRKATADIEGVSVELGTTDGLW